MTVLQGSQASALPAAKPLPAPGDSPSPAEWIRQDRAAIRTVEELSRHIRLTPHEVDSISKACRKFQMKIPPYYLGLMNPDDPSCPIRRQAIPDARELRVMPSELADPIGDVNEELNNQPVAALTHRYPDRVLLYPTPLCGNYCRHCFRRRLAGKREFLPSENQVERAIRYIESHPGIREVILTGGDPLMLPDERIVALLARLKRIPHVRLLRIHTRMPVVNPYRLTPELAAHLRTFAPLWVVTHFNHPRELSPVAVEHLGRLVDHGVPVLNQGVLLKGVNDDADTLRELGLALAEARVKPYYLHHLDRAQGLSHFRVGVRRGLQLLRELRGTVPGHTIPSYILDIPKGYGKVPLQYHYLSTDEKERLYVETPDGDYILYADTAEENPVPPSTLPASLTPLEAYPEGREVADKLRKVLTDDE